MGCGSCKAGNIYNLYKEQRPVSLLPCFFPGKRARKVERKAAQGCYTESTLEVNGMNEQILAVQRMQDYIEAHIDEELTLATLAQVSLFSPWYSYRLFRRYTGLSPADYIRRLRLSRSAMQLKNGDGDVTATAFSLGFGSVDGYRRAFFREFGCNPGEYTRCHRPLPLFIPYGVKFRELRKEVKDMETISPVFVQLVHKPARKVILKRGVAADEYFAYCGEVGCDVWGVLSSMDSLCGEPVCLWLPEAYRTPGTSVYVQGVEADADYAGPIPEGFDTILLPAAEYLQFQGEPFREEDYVQAIARVHTAMERYDPTLIGYTWDDTNPRIQLEPRGDRGYIELRAVRPLRP